MAIIQCPNKHYYDNQKFQECPHCKNLQGGAGEERSVPTVAKFNSGDTSNSYNSVTRRSYDYSEADNSGKTQSIYMKNKNSNPISGWLVCIKGENRGKSFELHIGNNFVGRSMKSDVIINDLQVSRENHFSIIYEPKSCKFYVAPGASIIYLNSNRLDNSSPLKEDDVIQAGESKFVFIPFCREGRDWND